MPAGARSLIVGGGIRAGTPATLGNLPQFSGVTPPDILIDSILRQAAGPPAAIIVGATDPSALATETFRTEGGAIFDFPGRADATVIGRAATAGADQQIAIGLRAGVGAVFAGTGSVAVRADARAGGVGVAIGVTAISDATSGSTGGIAVGSNANAGATGVAIGAGSQATGTASVGIATGSFGAAGSDSICIGGGASNARGVSAIALAGQVNLGADNCIVVGRGSVATGGASQVMLGHDINGAQFAANNNVCLGNGATPFGNNVCMIGGGDGSAPTIINTVIIGRGDSNAAAHTVTLRSTNRSGTDVAAGDMILQAPLGTGNQAAGGQIQLRSGVPGAAGTTMQTPRAGFAVRASVTAADTDGMIHDVDTATLARISVGAAGSGGGGFKLLRIPN